MALRIHERAINPDRRGEAMEKPIFGDDGHKNSDDDHVSGKRHLKDIRSALTEMMAIPCETTNI